MGRAKRAIRTRRRGVRVDPPGIDIDGGPAIGTGRGIGAGGNHARSVIGIGAGIEPGAHLAGQQGAVLAAPVRIQAFMPCRRVVTIDSSTLFWIRTGRFALRASATVIGSILVYDLLPNPPPSQGTTMRTLATGSWKRSAISARTRKGCWQLDCSVTSSPAASIRRWWCGFPWRIGRPPGSVYSPSTTISASAKTASHRPGELVLIVGCPDRLESRPAHGRAPIAQQLGDMQMRGVFGKRRVDVEHRRLIGV